MDIRVGDIIAFKGKGPIFKSLSWVLGVFEPQWRKRKWKPWHLAVASRKVDRVGWILLEALAGGVQEKYHDLDDIKDNTRVYRWLNKAPTQKKVEEFRKQYIGYPYDAGAYFGVIFTYLLWKLTGKSMRVIDTQCMCWEATAAFCRFMGKPLQPIYEYPVISRIMEKLEG